MRAISLVSHSPVADWTLKHNAKFDKGSSPRWCFTDSIDINTLRPRRNDQHFADDIFKRNFNENIWISIKISLKFVPKGPINNITALVQIMVWRRSGYKPLSEPMMVSLPTHICVTRPQWVKVCVVNYFYVKLWHMIVHTCHNFNGSLVEIKIRARTKKLHTI